MIRGRDQGRAWLSVGVLLGLRLCFWQANNALTGLETTALLEQFNALIALQHAAFCSDRAATFKAGMLAHGSWNMEGGDGKGN